MKRILVIGSTNIDLTLRVSELPRPGETVMSTDLLKLPGGKGANQAYACGRLGGETAFLSCVGQDGLGELMEANMRAAGVDTALVARSPLPTGMALITVDRRGGNSIVVVPGANGACTADFITARQTAILACDILLIQLELPLGGVTRAIECAKAAGKTVILNPAPAPDAPLPAELLRGLDYLTPNETELSKLTGLPTDTPEQVRAAAARLLERGVGHVIVTLGGSGCLAADRNGLRHYPAFPVEPVDTTAAGDTFNGALAVGLARGEALEEAIPFANAAAALSVTALGAQASVPGAEETARFLVKQISERSF